MKSEISKIWTARAAALFAVGLLAVVGPSYAQTGDEPQEGPQQSEDPTDQDSGTARQEADGQETDEPQVDESDDRLNIYDRVEIRQRADDLTGLTASASEGSTGAEDLAARPISRAGQLLETAPGVIATQHSGGGKANQYFLRGFNLDHGTDFRVTAGGTPVNMPSHGHGQGYADLSFVIPEMVDRVAYKKGTYYANTGDFSAAGAVDMRFRRALDQGRLAVSTGEYGFVRALLADTFEVAGGDLTAAIDVSDYDGPWTREGNFKKLNGLLSFHRGDSARGYSLTATAYDGDWLSTDQIPRREVSAGRLGRFDLLDPGPRGETQRYGVSAEVHRGGDTWLSSLEGYLVSYDFNLISNFTYFLEDAEEGDQFEQIDERLVLGLRGQHDWIRTWGERTLENRAGFDLRWDDIDNGLFRTNDLNRIGTVREDTIGQLGAGLWADTTLRWSDSVRVTLGLRGDYYDADVQSSLATNSDRVDDLLLSPNLSLLFRPFEKTEFFANVGYGFHSNDARGATIRVDPLSGEAAERVEPLVQARGAEIGFRTQHSGWTTSVVIFGLELDSELVFVGDGGATEASRPSRRIGVEWANFYRANSWLSLDLDLTWTDAEFTDNDPAGAEIPGAIASTVAAGVSITDLGRFSGSLRWRYFADIPLIEDNSVDWSSTSVVNASLGWELPGDLDLRLDIFNLLDRDDSDVEYFYGSRLPGEAADGVEDVHFHPMEPRNARLTLGWRF